MNYVVGSGPSGVAAASALLDRGQLVTMIDVGVQCEPERLAMARSLAARTPDQWSDSDLRAIRGPAAPGIRLPRKLSFGSAFAYATDDAASVRQTGTNCVQSCARGGLSNVWGAAVLPNTPGDLEGWPFSMDELAPHYARVAALMPIAGTVDELERLFPFHHAPAEPLRPSFLAAATLRRMREHRGALESDGMSFGQSRLAVRTTTDGNGTGCQYSGLCLSGCPYFAIWNASSVVDALQGRPGFTYRPGIHVERIESTADGVRLSVRSTGEGGAATLDGRRAFLACGPISTARLIIDSLGLYGRTLPLQFQPYFLLPMIALRGSGDIERERLHTLAQVFLEIDDADVSSRTVHLQMYTFNEYMRERLDRVTAWLGPISPLARRSIGGRLMAVQGYLHSAEAIPIQMTSHADAESGVGMLTLTAQPDPRVGDIVGRVVRTLRRHARHIGAWPIARLLEMGRPGDGNHVGGTFPMRREPGDLETNVDGQLAGLPHVHLVDSSSLPSLAATTFTYTTMAHAHRIADRVARREDPSHV